MKLASTIGIYAGGVGSGCNPAAGKCGRHTGAANPALKSWIEDEDHEPLSALVSKLQQGTLDDAASKHLADLARAAQSELGKQSLTGYRITLEPGEESPVQDKSFTSYMHTREAAEAYKNEFAGVHPNAKIDKVEIPLKNVVTYYKQSKLFDPDETEIIVSRKPLKI